MEKVRASLFADENESTDLEIKTINTWRMEGVLAENMSERSDDPQVFLAGDAAHAFPPSGGFGMNTGICDAQNLAHKIASAIHFNDHPCLKSYDPERRLVGRLTRDFSMLNHAKAIKIAKMLNLNKGNLDLY